MNLDINTSEEPPHERGITLEVFESFSEVQVFVVDILYDIQVLRNP